MADVFSLPNEILDIVFNELVVTVGIQKAVLLRTVNKRFDAAIERSICVAHVVDVFDPATEGMWRRMPKTLLGKVLAIRSVTADADGEGYLSVIAKVTAELDTFLGGNEHDSRARRNAIAAEIQLENCGEQSAREQAHNVLCGAAIIGDLQTFRLLFESNQCSSTLTVDTNFNRRTPYFNSLLTLAAGTGHLELVLYLIRCGARVSELHDDWSVSSILAGNARWRKAVEDSRASNSTASGPVTEDKHPSNAVLAAVLGGHENIVRLLLRRQHRFRTTIPEYLRALLSAARIGRVDLIEAICRVLGKDVSAFPGLALEMLLEAIRSGSHETVQWLVDRQVNINEQHITMHGRKSTALGVASAIGDADMVRFLWKHAASVDTPGIDHRVCRSLVQTAAHCGQEEIVEFFLEHGADPVAALESAGGAGQPRLIKLLLQKHPDLLFREHNTTYTPERNVGKSVMYNAMFTGNLTAMTLLAEAGVSLNEGFSHPSHLPMYMAKKYLGSWAVDHLLALGAHDTEAETRPCLLEHSAAQCSCGRPRDNCRRCYRFSDTIARGVKISERTWEWVSKY